MTSTFTGPIEAPADQSLALCLPTKEDATLTFGISSSIEELLANPATLAFIEKNMPELPKHPMLAMIKSMPPRQR